MKYLVTGGTGFIGHHLVIRLIEDGYNVRVLDNDFRGHINSLKDYRKNFEFIKGDIRNQDLIKKSCKNINRIIHLVAINGTEIFYQIPEEVLDVGTRGIINIIDGAIKYNCELFVASSSEVYHLSSIIPTPETVPLVIPDPYNARYSYSGSKIISELYTIWLGGKYLPKAIIFRPHNVYGPNMGNEHVIPQFIKKFKELEGNEFFIQGTGKETRAFIYIDDFIDALLLIINKGQHKETYNIGTENEITIEKLVHQMAQYFTDKQIKIIPGELQKGGTIRRVPDITKLRQLGFWPSVSLDEGLKKTIEWYK